MLVGSLALGERDTGRVGGVGLLFILRDGVCWMVEGLSLISGFRFLVSGFWSLRKLGYNNIIGRAGVLIKVAYYYSW